MPAAAVIPAPRAYMNVVAVKKPVVGFEGFARGTSEWTPCGKARHGPHLGIALRHVGTFAGVSEIKHSSWRARSRHCE